jgi:hypothetical protein
MPSGVPFTQDKRRRLCSIVAYQVARKSRKFLHVMSIEREDGENGTQDFACCDGLLKNLLI